MHTTGKTTKKMAMGLALSLSLALPAYAQVLPGTLDGNFAILNEGTVTFTGNAMLDGTATIAVGAVEYLVVAGGGGAGGGRTSTDGPGGGGGGGVLTGATNLAAASFDVVVGAGGLGSPGSGSVQTPGQNSRFDDIIAIGGGRGGGVVGSTVHGAGPGGSGGGGLQGGSGGLGTTGQGHNGGTGHNAASSGTRAGGGGGGATEAGQNGAASTGGKGGDGLQSSITGTPTYYGGGGGGGVDRLANTVGAGGLGGGGAGGANATGQNGVNGLGGGGGGGLTTGGNGGNGVVHIRYAGDSSPAASGGTVDSISNAPYTLHSYTSTGSSTFTPFSGYDPLTQHATISGNLSGGGGLNATGPGTLVLSGNNSYAGTTAVSSGILVVDGTHTGGAAFTVAGGTAFGGGGSINSALTLEANANFWWDGSSTLTVVNGNAVSLDETFGIESLVGFDWDDIANGTYTLIANDTVFGNLNIQNWGSAAFYELADGRQAWFSEGSLQLNVVPEPSALGLLGIGLLTMYGLRRRRCA